MRHFNCLLLLVVFLASAAMACVDVPPSVELTITEKGPVAQKTVYGRDKGGKQYQILPTEALYQRLQVGQTYKFEKKGLKGMAGGKQIIEADYVWIGDLDSISGKCTKAGQ